MRSFSPTDKSLATSPHLGTRLPFQTFLLPVWSHLPLARPHPPSLARLCPASFPELSFFSFAVSFAGMYTITGNQSPASLRPTDRASSRDHPADCPPACYRRCDVRRQHRTASFPCTSATSPKPLRSFPFWGESAVSV